MDPETQYHVEDVGRILLQAQDALKNIRKDLQQGSTSPAMTRKIDELFDEAESNVRSKAQNVLSSVMRNQISTLPNIPPPRGSQTAGSGVRPSRRSRQAASRAVTRAQTAPFAGAAQSDSLHGRNARRILDKFGLLQDPTPAARHRAIDRRLARAISKKHKLHNRLIKKPTATRQSSLPAINRADASAPPPRVSERDIQAGLYSMISRGFVPKGTDLGPAFEYGPAPLQASTVPILEAPARREIRPETSTVGSFNVAGLRFDLSPPKPANEHNSSEHQSRITESSRRARTSNDSGQKSSSHHSRPNSHSKSLRPERERAKSKSSKREKSQVVTDDFAEAVEEIRGYNELLDEFSLHQFIVRKGRTLTDTPEYESFKRKHSNIWGSIKTVIRYLEDLLQLYSIPLAYVDGQKVAALALDELTEPTKEALVDCIANRDEVLPIIEATGQRFKADAGETLAAILIQSVWRMYGLRRDFVAERSRLHAAAAIQEMWRNAMVRASFIATLWRKRTRDRSDMDELQTELVASWGSVSHKHRIVVHVPSVGYNIEKRKTMYDLQREQNLTLARLCDVKDPTVDVIYVAPFHMNEETIQYWQRILQIGGVKHARSRFTIVVPENLDRFPSHLSLTQLLLYSPRALNKIRNLVGSQEAYIVAGAINDDTERLALELQIPLMGARSESAQFYSSCSGATGIFTESKLMVPHGCRDIYDEQQFLLTLTKLIAAFPTIKQWIFRIEGEFGERGIATIETSRITGYSKVMKLYKKMAHEPPSHWARPEVQQSVQESILSDLEESLLRWMCIQREDLYSSYREYIEAFCKDGGAIEAKPPNIRGRPSAGLFIAPTGEVQVLCTHNNAYYHNFVVGAGIFPQDCVPPAAIYGASKAVGKTLYHKGVFGYAEVHFTVWYDLDRGMPALWATDLKLELTRNTASYNLFDFLMRGHFDAVAGKYMVNLGRDPDTRKANNARLAIMNKGKPIPKSVTSNWQVRSYIYSDAIRLRRISRLHYGSFFNLCRLEHISFDLPRRSGTVFQLIDSLSRGIFGLMCIAKAGPAAVGVMQKNLHFIKEQVSASTTQNSRVKPHDMDNFNEIVSCIRQLYQS